MIAVAGATGHTGKAVADALLQLGRPVRVIVRDAVKGESWKARGAEVAVASLDDADALSRALAGVDSAYLLIPPAYAATDALAAQRVVVNALAEAVGRSQLRHVVLLSSIGGQHATGVGPIPRRSMPPNRRWPRRGVRPRCCARRTSPRTGRVCSARSPDKASCRHSCRSINRLRWPPRPISGALQPNSCWDPPPPDSRRSRWAATRR